MCKTPYVVNLNEAFLHEARIWLSIEFCGGGSLLDIMRVRGRCLTEKQIQVVMRETLKGIYYLHHKKIIHRDLKAGNILVNHQGLCKLADFGVSKKQSTMDKATTQIGSPYWMAPEVFTSATYTEAVDIWSLGCTCIELAIGKPPFADLHPLKAILTIPTADPPRLPDGLPKDFSDGFKEFIASCCIKDPKERPTAAHLFRNLWVRGSKGLRVLQRLVAKAQPYLDEWRKKMREDDEADQSDSDEEVEKDEEDSAADEFDGGTTVFAGDKAGSGREEEEDESDPFDGGTTLITRTKEDEKGEDEDAPSAAGAGDPEKFAALATEIRTERSDASAMEGFGGLSDATTAMSVFDFQIARENLLEQMETDKVQVTEYYDALRKQIEKMSGTKF
jgi:serine/threonine protein kinase